MVCCLAGVTVFGFSCLLWLVVCAFWFLGPFYASGRLLFGCVSGVFVLAVVFWWLFVFCLLVVFLVSALYWRVFWGFFFLFLLCLGFCVYLRGCGGCGVLLFGVCWFGFCFVWLGILGGVCGLFSVCLVFSVGWFLWGSLGLGPDDVRCVCWCCSCVRVVVFCVGSCGFGRVLVFCFVVLCLLWSLGWCGWWCAVVVSEVVCSVSVLSGIWGFVWGCAWLVLLGWVGVCFVRGECLLLLVLGCFVFVVVSVCGVYSWFVLLFCVPWFPWFSVLFFICLG